MKRNRPNPFSQDPNPTPSRFLREQGKVGVGYGGGYGNEGYNLFEDSFGTEVNNSDEIMEGSTKTANNHAMAISFDNKNKNNNNNLLSKISESPIPSESPDSPESSSLLEAEVEAGQLEDLGDKRKKSLERNRLAASKCRLKKKEKVSGLQARHDELAKTHEKLLALRDELQEELFSVQNAFLASSITCDCEPVRAYLHSLSQRTLK